MVASPPLASGSVRYSVNCSLVRCSCMMSHLLQPLAHCCQGAGKVCFYRPHFKRHRLRDLLESHLFGEAQQENRALSGRKLVHRRPYGLQLLARAELLLRRSRRVRQGLCGGCGVFPIRPAKHASPEAVSPAAGVVDGQVHGDAHQPRSDTRLSAKALAVPIGAEETLLSQRAGGIGIPHKAQQNPVDAPLVRADALARLAPREARSRVWAERNRRVRASGQRFRACQRRLQASQRLLLCIDDFPAAGFTSPAEFVGQARSEEHTSELQSLAYLVCRLLLEKKKILSVPIA